MLYSTGLFRTLPEFSGDPGAPAASGRMGGLVPAPPSGLAIACRVYMCVGADRGLNARGRAAHSPHTETRPRPDNRARSAAPRR